jgi:hypothetical protein
MAMVENRHTPLASTNAVEFCNSVIHMALSLVVNGSSFTGFPKCSTAIE